MTNRVLIILAIVCHTDLSAQIVNFVPNPGFEYMNCCPEHENTWMGNPTPNGIPCLKDWTEPQRQHIWCKVGTADYCHTCGDFNPCPIGPRTGNGYARVIIKSPDIAQYREYIASGLTSYLIPGHVYQVEFYLTTNLLEGYVGSIGAYFSESRPESCQSSFLIGRPTPQVENTTTLSYNRSWIKFSDKFVAGGAYGWITIGNFKDDDHTIVDGLQGGQHVYIDDIRIFETCTPELLIENTVYNDEETVYEADVIKAGYDVGAATANGNVVVSGGADITYKAAQSVVLRPGFSVERGGKFHAFIAPCDRNCFAPQAFAGADTTYCSLGCHMMGIPGQYGFTYEWSAEPVEALAYLSNPAAAAPDFCPPSSGYGTFIYTLTVRNACGETASDKVLIHYSNQPDSNPSVVLSNVSTGDFISFDAGVGAQTEQVIIEVFAAQNLQHPVRTYTLRPGIDFACCSLHWQIPEYLSVCSDYKVKVSVKNFCSSAIYTTTIAWNRNRNISVGTIPNVFTPNGDHINDCLTVPVQSVEFFNVEIRDRWGVLIYVGGGIVKGTEELCLWSGQCNTGFPSHCKNGKATDDVYYGIVSFYNACSAVYSRSFTATLLGNPLRIDAGSIGYHAAEIRQTSGNNPDVIPSEVILADGESEMLSGRSILYPNPNEGEFTVESEIEIEFVYVYDQVGRIIFRDIASPGTRLVRVNLSTHAPGLYFVQMIGKEGASPPIKMLVYPRQ